MTESSVAETWEIARNELGDGGHGCLGCAISPGLKRAAEKFIAWGEVAGETLCRFQTAVQIEYFSGFFRPLKRAGEGIMCSIPRLTPGATVFRPRCGLCLRCLSAFPASQSAPSAQQRTAARARSSCGQRQRPHAAKRQDERLSSSSHRP